MRLNFHLWGYFDSLTSMKTLGASFGFVLRSSGMLLLAGSLACTSTSLNHPGDAGSGASSGSGGGTGGVLGSGGALGSGEKIGSGGGPGAGGVTGNGGGPSSGGATGFGGGPGSGGATGSGGGPVTGGMSGYGGGGPGMGGVPSSGGRAGSGGAPGTGGKTSLDGGSDAPTAPDAAPEVLPADGSPADHADTAIINTSDADTRGTDALSPGEQEYVNTYLQPYCTRLAECCAQAGIPYSGQGACEAHELGFVKYLDDGSEVIVPSVIQTVLDQIKASCDQPSYALIGATTDGTRTSGQPCVAVDQCAGTPALCLSGTCMTPPRGKAGDGCAVTCDDATDCKWGTSGGKSPNSVCYDQDGLRCDSTTNTCVPVTAIGAVCTDYSECGAHAACSNGTCQALAKSGQDCGSGPGCDSNLQCVSSSGTAYTCQPLSIAWSGSCSP